MISANVVRSGKETNMARKNLGDAFGARSPPLEEQRAIWLDAYTRTPSGRGDVEIPVALIGCEP